MVRPSLTRYAFGVDLRDTAVTHQQQLAVGERDDL
jgi:hypothetical protein